MLWIQSHTGLIRHRKTYQLANVLSVPLVQVVGHLHALWHTVLEQQEDGDLSNWPNEMIAQAAAYTGDAASFVRALQETKFLDDKLVHDWLDYVGRYLTSKYHTSNPQRLKAIYKLHRGGLKVTSRSPKGRRQVANIRLDEIRLDEITQDPPRDPPLSPEQLAEKFNNIPGVRKVEFNGRLPGTARQAALARLKAYPSHEDWNRFFERIAQSQFLTGRKVSPGRDPFHATFTWVLGPKNFDKIMLGNYTDHPVKKRSFVHT